MRTRRTWSGTFRCDLCKIEEDLRDDESAECRECGELMTPGPLYEDGKAETNSVGGPEAR